MIKNTITITLLFLSFIASAQENDEQTLHKIKPFIGYELGQAVFNDFKSLSGEVGLRFSNKHLIRLTHMNVKMSEAHLSSGFAVVVQGDHVEGSLFGFESFYDFPIFWDGFYMSPSFGWYINEYHHTILDENLRKESATIGFAISYREIDVFKVKGLYYTLSFPMRTPFNPIEETKLGNTTIKSNTFDSNIFFFVGYEF